MMMLNVQRKNSGTVSLLNVQGQFVIGETDGLQDVIRDLPPTRTVIMDLSHVSRLDAHGLGVMLQLREQAQARDMQFQLTNISDPLRELLHITRLDSVFHIKRRVESFPVAA